MDEERTLPPEDQQPGRVPEPDGETDAASQDPPSSAGAEDPELSQANREPRRYAGRSRSRWESLERLDRQWEDPTPIREITGLITSLALTTHDDPRGWDYIGALVGSPPDETARACEVWLEAQLVADAVSLGRALRPRVELVPAGRVWFVVRTVADMILVIDGPGFLTPVAAAIAASRRYHAELLRALERHDDTDTQAPEPEEESRTDADVAQAETEAETEPTTPSPDAPEGMQ